ncbi:MAG: hypothetical protein ABI670_10030 [Chloroflexota bacterium]
MPNLVPITLLPFSVTIVGAIFSAVLLNRYFFSGKRRPHELTWGFAFLLFAVASACQVYADVLGHWTDASARIFYLTGGILNVGFLGVGTVYLLFSRRLANASLAIMVVFSVISAFVVFNVPVDAAALQIDPGYKAVVAVSSTPRILAALSNAIGSILVIGGALWSGLVFWRKRIMKQRMIGVFLIAAGTLIVALGGTILGLTGLKNPEYHYVGMVVGVIVMFVGYLQSIRVTLPQAQVAERVTATGSGAR